MDSMSPGIVIFTIRLVLNAQRFTLCRPKQKINLVRKNPLSHHTTKFCSRHFALCLSFVVADNVIRAPPSLPTGSLYGRRLVD